MWWFLLGVLVEMVGIIALFEMTIDKDMRDD